MEQQPQQQVVAAAQFTCSQCKKTMQAKFPIPTLMNQVDVSLIVFVHERPAKCPHCGMQYMFGLSGIDSNMTLGIGWKPIGMESTIVPGTNENYLLTVTNADIANKLKQ